jgi:hypothetical protein
MQISCFNKINIDNCCVSLLQLKDTQTSRIQLVVHCNMSILPNYEIEYNTLARFLRLVNDKHEQNKQFHANKLSYMCIMQSQDVEKDYVAVFCAAYICLGQERERMNVNVRDAIRNVRIQLNSPSTSFTSFDEYICVYECLLKNFD